MAISWNPESDGTFYAARITDELDAVVYPDGLGTFGYIYGPDLRERHEEFTDVPGRWPTVDEAKRHAAIDLRGCIRFEVGDELTARSAGDYDCVWRFTVTKRTARFITLEQDSGETMRVGVREHDGEEWASPFGSYSLAPVVRAGRQV